MILSGIGSLVYISDYQNKHVMHSVIELTKHLFSVVMII